MSPALMVAALALQESDEARELLEQLASAMEHSELAATAKLTGKLLELPLLHSSKLVWNVRAEALFTLQDWAYAWEAYNWLCEQDKDSAHFSQRLTDCYMHVLDDNLSLPQPRRPVRAWPSLRQLGEIEQEMQAAQFEPEDREERFASLYGALADGPAYCLEHAMLWNALVRFHDAELAGEVAETVELGRRLLKHTQYCTGFVNGTLGERYFELGDRAAAAQHLVAAADELRNAAFYQYLAGRALASLGRWDAALPYLRAALRLGGSTEEAGWLARALLELGRHDAAYELLSTQVADRSSWCSLAWGMLCYRYFELGRSASLSGPEWWRQRALEHLEWAHEYSLRPGNNDTDSEEIWRHPLFAAARGDDATRPPRDIGWAQAVRWPRDELGMLRSVGAVLDGEL